MHNPINIEMPKSKPVNYRNISLALVAIVFIQATVIAQLYFVSSSCQAATTVGAASGSTSTAVVAASSVHLKGSDKDIEEGENISTEEASGGKEIVCGILRNIPVGEHGALPLGLPNTLPAGLIHPTAGAYMGGPMVTDGPVPAIVVRAHQEGHAALYSPPTDSTSAESHDWIFACVNKEYIKMMRVTIKKDSLLGLMVFVVEAGYLNVHSLHALGSGIGALGGGMATPDLSPAVITHAWQNRVSQESDGYKLTSLSYCVCEAVSSPLPTSQSQPLRLTLLPPSSSSSPVGTESVTLTDSQTTLGGSQVTGGPVSAKVFRTPSPSSTGGVVWLVAAVNGEFIKMVEVNVLLAQSSPSDTAPALSLSLFASNSGYVSFSEFGVHDTESLTGGVVQAAWAKRTPNVYEVTTLTYYVLTGDAN